MFLLIFTLNVATFLPSGSSLEINKRIIGGTHAQDGSYPWSAYIKYVSKEYRSSCGATIISNQWLLTAAHCMWPVGYIDLNRPELWHVQIGRMKVVAGSEHTPEEQIIDGNRHSYYRKDQLKTENLRFHVERIIFHPNHEIGLLEYDIALMKIKGRIPYMWGKSVPASLPISKQIRQWTSGDRKCTIVGWGCTKPRGNTTDVASVAELKVLYDQTCGQLLIGVNKDHEFCAGYYNSSVGLCHGDSGSGLIYKHHGSTTVIGVASGSDTEEPQSYPGVFVRVAAFIDWIQTEMKRS
ncbi:hypothetical protein EG68_04966 [Paragonimus skrjabini miyazakii]|uniref:Peptidase S1 domain-containing protein n=1 Tax=Paragonimus skrjabini miyazakii TaxID=59628 RepID=A0A8S9YSW8_9TREM|nr:hypothetical protein EG68_04966 [Paragonimus skrjabini miyazakii]